MKLIIQIPCYNERDHLPETLADLPRSLDGIDEIELLVIDDGSEDDTAEVAEKLGVHHVIRFRKNRGLAAAHMAGLDAALRLGADLIVNTDADNQYRGEDVQKLIQPILDGRADIVIGDRDPGHLPEFSPAKRLLQRWGTSIVRRASGISVSDSTSGFRALNRRAAERVFVHNRFSYTLETIVQAGQAGLAVENVPIGTNPKKRPSRLFKSIPDYLRRNGPVIFRSYAMYWPLKTFGVIALVLFAFGSALGIRFLYYFVQDPAYSGHVQSLLVGVGSIILAFLVGLFALLGDLMAANRRLTEEALWRLRRLETASARTERLERETLPTGDMRTTGAPPWGSTRGS